MKYPKFLEYLNSKGKLQEKPTVDPMADQLDPADDKTPPKAVTSGKGWKIEVPSTKEAPKPYRGPGVAEKPKGAETGFANKGSIPAWNPDMSQGSSKNVPGGKEIDGWKKSKTEAFLNKTKGMNINEFTRYMIETCGCGGGESGIEGLSDELPMVTSYTAGKFHPHPPEAVRYVVFLANKNDRVLENLIQELKRGGGMKKLIKALMDDHPESYDSLTDLLDDDEGGDQRASALARSMSDKLKKFTDMFGESVVSPFGFEDEDEEPEEGAEGDEEMEVPDSDEDMEDMEDEGDADEEGNGDEPPAMEMEPEEDNPPPMPPPRKNKKMHGLGRLLKALDRYENMSSYMRSCMNPE